MTERSNRYEDAHPKAFDAERSDAPQEKPIPRWMTSWPEWYGIAGNVLVVPASDYDALKTRVSEIAPAVPEPERLRIEREATAAGYDLGLEEAAKAVEYRGQCSVAMINTEERIEEKKAYAWDTLQHGVAIRALKIATPQGQQAVETTASRVAPAESALVSGDLATQRAIHDATQPCVVVPKAIAERTEAMFRSVDPTGNLAVEWKRALRNSERSKP